MAEPARRTAPATWRRALRHAAGETRIAFPGRRRLILGPYEVVGRLPWWLRRIERGGRVLAPGDPSRSLQYIDARELAAWMLSAAERRLGGAYNTVSRPGHATMGRLLDATVEVTGSGAELVWAPAEVIEEAGISGWTELPIWLPDDDEYGGMHDGNVTAAYDAGLTCRPVRDTVADTWTWLQAEGDPARPASPRARRGQGAGGVPPAHRFMIRRPG